MELEEVAQDGNRAAMELCQEMLDRLGPGKEYECAIGAAATSFVFHAFRLALPRSEKDAIEFVQVLLNDVAYNLKEKGG